MASLAGYGKKTVHVREKDEYLTMGRVATDARRRSPGCPGGSSKYPRETMCAPSRGAERDDTLGTYLGTLII